MATGATAGDAEPASGPGTPGGTPERPAVFFADAAELRAWFERHHDTATELWTGLRGKHVDDRGLTWADAVLVALCYGWIDSANERVDDDARRQRWTPRRSGSTWSAVNVAHVERLREQGLMTPAGEAAYALRREDRTATYSYERPAGELPERYAARLAGDPAASAFWAEATAGYRRVAVHWVLGAKQESTRDRRIAQLVDDSAAGRLIPSQRYGDAPRWVERAAAAARAAQPGR